MQDKKMTLLNLDGTKTEVEDPFRGMRSTYDALRADPNAIPELSDESRAAILAEIDNRTAPAQTIEPKTAPTDNTYFKPNRNDRRRAAAIARRERKQKTRKH